MKLALPQFGAHIHSQGGKLAAIVRAPLVNGAEQPPIALILTDVEFESKWGEYGKLIEGAASRTDGKANTAAMLAAGCPAAAQLAELEAEGHNDLFIPAIGQLNAAACNVPELFAADGVYWASTQASRDYGFVQVFADGYSGWGAKYGEFRVRAFRQIPLEYLIA
jgi:hypothetical protein